MRSSNQPDNYRSLLEKLIQLEPNNWQKFQELLKKLHLAGIRCTEAQTKLEEITAKKNKPESLISWSSRIV